jgi:hypothetical protein
MGYFYLIFFSPFNMIRKNFRRAIRSRPSNRRTTVALMQNQPRLDLYSKSWATPGFKIPQRIFNPSIMKVVRLTGVLTNSASAFSFTYVDLSAQDSADYAVSGERYTTLRVQKCRAYLESYPTTSTTSAIGCILTETNSAFSVQDRPVIGSSVAAVGMLFSLQVREGIVAVTSTITIATLESDLVIPSGSNCRYTIDVWCQFA